jgi:hypothetical protein
MGGRNDVVELASRSRSTADRARLLEDVARTFSDGANIVSYGGTVEDGMARNCTRPSW